jgi:sec-independent protein translocase protein TatB
VFNLQGSEIIIVLLLALVVLGPEKLPDAMRKAGQLYAELKKMSSGFQSEFRAAVEEPLREIRDTANVLRDSADFTKLRDGEREEKPKSADMLAPGDPDAVPSDEIPTFDTAPGDSAADQPEMTEDSKPAPFSVTVTTGGRDVSQPRRTDDAPEPTTSADDVGDVAADAPRTEDVEPEPDDQVGSS